MEGLIKAFSDVLAAVLGALGFVGRPRRRAAIRQDLELLRDLEQSPEFATGTAPHSHLVAHIGREIARHSGAVVPRRKKVDWGGVVVGFSLTLPLCYWTYALNRDGFSWLSLLPGVISLLFLIAITQMIASPDDKASSEE